MKIKNYLLFSLIAIFSLTLIEARQARRGPVHHTPSHTAGPTTSSAGWDFSQIASEHRRQNAMNGDAATICSDMCDKKTCRADANHARRCVVACRAAIFKKNPDGSYMIESGKHVRAYPHQMTKFGTQMNTDRINRAYDLCKMYLVKAGQRLPEFVSTTVQKTPAPSVTPSTSQPVTIQAPVITPASASGSVSGSAPALSIRTPPLRSVSGDSTAAVSSLRGGASSVASTPQVSASPATPISTGTVGGSTDARSDAPTPVAPSSPVTVASPRADVVPAPVTPVSPSATPAAIEARSEAGVAIAAATPASVAPAGPRADAVPKPAASAEAQKEEAPKPEPKKDKASSGGWFSGWFGSSTPAKKEEPVATPAKPADATQSTAPKADARADAAPVTAPQPVADTNAATASTTAPAVDANARVDLAKVEALAREYAQISANKPGREGDRAVAVAIVLEHTAKAVAHARKAEGVPSTPVLQSASAEMERAIRAFQDLFTKANPAEQQMIAAIINVMSGAEKIMDSSKDHVPSTPTGYSRISAGSSDHMPVRR